MKRYIFLLLAFFLATSAHAEGLISGMGSVNATPNTIVVQNVNSTPDIKGNVGNKSGATATTNNTVPDTNRNADPTTISSVPSTTNSAGATTTDIKRSSSRNTTEVGSVVEPSVSGARTTNTQLNNSGTTSSRTGAATKTTKTSANSMSCKTYEGKIYDQGEAGYADCMRNIRTDRQGTRSVP